MDIEQVLPHVLECIDTDRLGRRKVALLELVYRRQAGQRCSVHMGPSELAREGRSRSQAGYDRRALNQLVDLGILRRIPGRGRIPNGYSLREPRLWDSKRIRFLGPREHVISFFWRLQPRDLILLSRDGAGQTMFLCATGRTGSGSLAARSSVSERATTKFRRATKLAPGASIGTHQRATRSGRPWPHTQLPEASKEACNSYLEEEETRVAEEANQLGRAVAKRIGKERLWGRALGPVEAVIRRYPDHIDDLYHLAVTVPADILSPPEAAATFEAIADAAAAAGWPHPNAEKIAVLQRRIRALEDFDPEADQLLELRAELGRLRAMAS